MGKSVCLFLLFPVNRYLFYASWHPVFATAPAAQKASKGKLVQAAPQAEAKNKAEVNLKQQEFPSFGLFLLFFCLAKNVIVKMFCSSC